MLTTALITLIGEYLDKPHTLVGQLFQLLLLTIWHLYFWCNCWQVLVLLGDSSSWPNFTHEILPIKSFENHIIICNWSAKGPVILQQLVEANRHESRDIVILCTEAVELAAEFKE